MTPLEEKRTKAIENICVGIIAENMGYANQSNVVKSGKAIFDYIGTLTYKQFRNIKKLKAQQSNVL